MALYDYPQIHTYLPNSKTMLLTASIFNGNIHMYINAFLDVILFEKTNISVFVGAWVIFIAWMYFLWQQNPFSRIHYSKFIISGLNGFVAFVLLIPIYFLVASKLTISFGENSLIYYIFGVGFFEELIKIFPVIIFALVYGKKEEPYHYMVIAALSALLFATLENKLYFERYSIDIMDTRGLFTVILHVFDTSVITYFLIWRLFQKEGKGVVLWTVLGFVIMVIMHALYDWFLTNQLPFFGLIMFPFAVHILADMYNNTLNIAKSFNYDRVAEYRKNSFVITFALVIIILSRYVFVAIDYQSAEFALDALAGSSFMSLYLLVFLSMSFGKMDIFHGYWKKVGIPKSFFELILPRVVNSGEFLNRQVNLWLSKSVKIDGEILQRIVVKKTNDWYVLALNEPIQLGRIYTQYLFINFDDYDASIDEDHFCNVSVGIPPKGIDDINGIYYQGKLKPLGTKRLTKIK